MLLFSFAFRYMSLQLRNLMKKEERKACLSSSTNDSAFCVSEHIIEL